MAPSAKSNRILRAALLSLFAHGLLLLLALWLWPVPARQRAGAIASTRITLNGSTVDPGSSLLLPAGDLPADLRGPDVSLAMPPPPASGGRKPPVAVVQPGAYAPRSPNGTQKRGAYAPRSPNGNLFALPATANQVVYVLDRSVSMGENNKFDLACREVLASLRQLPPTARFQIVLYNDSAAPLRIGNRIDLLSPEPAIFAQTAEILNAVSASGGTHHANALRRGLALHPDVLFFVTDADRLPYEQIESITRSNRGVAIHVVELTRRGGSPDGPLARLARDNGGTYRRVALSP